MPIVIALLVLLSFGKEPEVWLYGGPKSGSTATYKDWVTRCDNERNCTAIALEATPELGGENVAHLEIMVEAPMAHHLDPVVSIKRPVDARADEELDLMLDAARIDLPPLANGRYVFSGPKAREMVLNMRAGTWLALHSPRGFDVARASLAGFTASLLKIDERQQKEDTPRALGRPGARKPYDPLPGYRVSLTRPARADAAPVALGAAARGALYKDDQCGGPDATRDPALKTARLDAQNTLVIAPWRCGNGAYNLNANIMIADNAGRIRKAEFDYDNGVTGEGPSNVVVNAEWDDGKRELEGFIKSRGIGDCGRVDRFIWDGQKFRLSEQLIMPECRMAFDRIRVWKTDVVDQKGDP
jgi:hypothetical protein